MGKKKKIRRKIAKRVEEKMYYLNTCLNERNIILNMIRPKKDRTSFYSHCKRDCPSTTCESNIDVDNQPIINRITKQENLNEDLKHDT